MLNYDDLLNNVAIDYDGSDALAAGNITLEQSGADTIVSFDADGSAGIENSGVIIATLQNVEATNFDSENIDTEYAVEEDLDPITDEVEYVIGTPNIPGEDLDPITGAEDQSEAPMEDAVDTITNPSNEAGLTLDSSSNTASSDTTDIDSATSSTSTTSETVASAVASISVPSEPTSSAEVVSAAVSSAVETLTI
jgi:hypothetical protein